MLPDFLIIGTQKSATTFLQECLEEHPEVYLPLDETTFFEDPDYKQTNIKEFESMFCTADNKKAIGIKRPNYLGKQECPSRIKKHIPDAKLIVVLRNPIERALSAYFHLMYWGFIPVESFEKGIVKLIEGEYPKAEEIITFGFYYKHLKNYLDYFDRKQILVLFFEDIKKNKLQVIKRVYNFLNIDESYMPKRINNRPQAVIYSIFRHKLLEFRRKTFNKERSLFHRIMRRIILKIDIGLSYVLVNKKPALSNSLKKRLYSIYEQDIDNLEKLLGVNLSHWKI